MLITKGVFLALSVLADYKKKEGRTQKKMAWEHTRNNFFMNIWTHHTGKLIIVDPAPQKDILNKYGGSITSEKIHNWQVSLRNSDEKTWKTLKKVKTHDDALNYARLYMKMHP